MRCKIWAAGALAVCMAASLSFAAVQTQEQGDRESGRNVLIASDDSGFKQAVIAYIIELLADDDCFVRVIDLADLSGEKSTEYHAIVLMNSCWAGQLNRHVKRFLDSVQYKEKVIVLTTAGNVQWAPREIEVDAITSASKIEEAQPVAEMLVSKIKDLFL